jgi:tripartite-type tricarboxylate transporter receptor subunit TctC
MDVVARTVSIKLTPRFGQTIVVDNRAGASGMIGVANAAKAPADGYTLLFDSVTSQAINPHLYPNIPYDTERDLVQIGVAAVQPYIFVGHPSLPENLRDLIALAKKNPNKVTVASYGIGSASHLAAELFQQHAGVKFLHVPYKGGPPAMTDLVAGRVMVHIGNLPLTRPLIQSGQLRAYGMASSQRASELPELATIEELLGFSGFNISTELGLMALAGTPSEVVTFLHKEFMAAVADPEVKARLAQLGFVEGPRRTLEEMAAHYKVESQRWGKIIKEANIKVE